MPSKYSKASLFPTQEPVKFPRENPLDLKGILAFHFHGAVSFMLTQKSGFVDGS